MQNIEKKDKKEVIIVGDSTIKHEVGRNTVPENIVKVRYDPRTTTVDMTDHVKPVVRKNRDRVTTTHTMTSYMQNEINTLKEPSNLINFIREKAKKKNKIKIAVSSIIHREDQNCKENVNVKNRKLKNLCKSRGVVVVNNGIIDNSYLNRSKLYMN